MTRFLDRCAVIFGCVALWGFVAAIALADETDSADVTRCMVNYYAVEQNANGVVLTASGSWANLDQVNFAQRRQALAEQLGFSSAIYAESLAHGAAAELARSLIFTDPLEIRSKIARLAACDVLFGFAPAITPLDDAAKRMVRLQARVEAASALEIVACSRVYEAGANTPEARKSPAMQVWANASGADFFIRNKALKIQADVVEAFANVPQSETYKGDAEIWKGKLPAALQAQDWNVQNAYWSEVARCDALLEVAAPVEPGPLATPKIAHMDCASKYAVLRYLYRQDRNAARYFQERGLHAGRFLRLLGSTESDQALLAQISQLAESQFKEFSQPDGQTDYGRIAQSFDEVATCDRQYGLSVTSMPQDIRQRARGG